MSKRKSTRPSLYGCDPLLVPRIKQYLATIVEPRNVSISTLVDHLQMQYNEYKRKKRRPFEKSVMRAYNNALQSIGHEEESDSGSTDVTLSDDLSSDIIEIDFPDGNLVNDSLRDLYSKNTSTPFNKTASSVSVNEKPNDSKSRTTITDKKNKEPHEKNGVTATSNKTSHEMKNRNDTGVKSQDATPVTKKRKVVTEKEAPNNVNNTYNKVKMKKDIQIQKSTTTFSDVGGNETCIQEICKLVAHLKHPEVYERLGVSPPRGLLLHGPPGCGKTLLANAIAGELDLSFIKIGATEIVAGISGESEEKIRDLFDTAVAYAPCVLFIDEIDSITPKRETAQREMERRIVTQLLTCLDDLNSKPLGTQVLVIGATNRPDSLDPALRRAGRFDREIRIGIPDVGARQRILEVLCRSLRLDPGFDFSQVAALTPGYVGADLMSLTREAAMFAVDRAFQRIHSSAPMSISSKTSEGIGTDAASAFTSKSMSSVLMWLRDQPPLTEEQMANLYVEMKDFESALKLVQPSAMREGFATVPDVTWDDVGALKEVREELKLAIMVPIRYPELYNDLGLTTPAGILLYGPPGCGKTLLAKAIANESGVNFISVKGPELLNMYVGESERAVRQCFQRAQNSAPCVIFFDELDALCPKRSDSAEGNASSRVVNQLLTEMDGIEKRRNVFILGATNRPDIIDPAVLRPGRLDKMLYVGIPTPDERLEILQTLTKNGSQPYISEDITLKELAMDDRCKSFTGADLAALIREASLLALQDIINNSASKPKKTSVARKHFEEALKKARPSAVR